MSHYPHFFSPGKISKFHYHHYSTECKRIIRIFNICSCKLACCMFKLNKFYALVIFTFWSETCTTSNDWEGRSYKKPFAWYIKTQQKEIITLSGLHSGLFLLSQRHSCPCTLKVMALFYLRKNVALWHRVCSCTCIYTCVRARCVSLHLGSWIVCFKQ